jgi:hypothetical protein
MPRTEQELKRIQNLAWASQQGKKFGPITERLFRTGRGTLTGALPEEDVPPPLPPPPGGGGYTLTFAQTEAGQRLAAALALETERVSGRERLKLEETLHGLAMELLPPKDVETAMGQVRRGELVKSKLAFQAVLQNLADEAEHAERRADLALEEENERRTLRDARARITVDTIGKDIGRAILFALGGAE